MKAKLLQKLKRTYGDGIIEIAIWQVPEAITPCSHNYKYRMVYIVNGIRLVGYDNERGKGDHCHYSDLEKSYQFMNIATLNRDFWRDIDNKIGESK